MAGQRPDQYLESFSWDEAKYPPRRALNETVSAITETTQKLEDDLKVSRSAFNLCSTVAPCLRGQLFGSCLLPSSDIHIAPVVVCCRPCTQVQNLKPPPLPL